MPTEDRFLMNEEEFKEQICMLLGGRSAEEIVFSTVTNGASDDLQRATTIAEKMVLSYGMSKIIGPLAYQKPDGTSFLGDNGSNANNRVVSEETARAIDDEVKQIVEQEHQRAIAIIQSNREMLETIANRLLNTEVIEGEELQSLLDQVKFDS